MATVTYPTLTMPASLKQQIYWCNRLDGVSVSRRPRQRTTVNHGAYITTGALAPAAVRRRNAIWSTRTWRTVTPLAVC